PHRVAPARLAHEAHRRAAAGKASVRVLVLPEARVRGGDADVAREVQLVAEIPRIAVRDDDERLGQTRLRFAGWIDRLRARRPPAGGGRRLERVDIDATRELLAVAEEHGGAQRRIVLVAVEDVAEARARRRIDAVLDGRAVEADE